MIVGKVAQILDDSLIVLNVGARDGVKVGMRMVVFEEGEEVRDPETQKSLGRVELVKGMIEVVHVQEAMSQATGAQETPQPGGTVLSEKMVKENIYFGLVSKAHRMNVMREEMVGRKSSGPIRVGDGVREVS